MKDGNRFGEFIANLRNEKRISQTELCDGLCTRTMLGKFENGERLPDKLLQNRFLTRLGAVPENYENFLFYKDYCRWEKQQGIIHNILEENMAKAKELLEEYRQEYYMKSSLEKQFYLAMIAQIKRYEGSKDEELTELFRYALLLTVPRLEQRGFMERILSLEELNLLLEYYHCGKAPLERYEELLSYAEQMDGTLLAMAKIYPKTVYYYYEAWMQQESKEKELAVRLLEVCEKAIELLRDANRMFYLWELFCMKEKLLPLLPEEIRTQPEFIKDLEDCKSWRETLEELYQEYDISIAMYEYCYLYVESENYCIGDVIRIRRKMLGLSQRRLAEGICDERTISNLECHKSKAQREVVQKLFERLNLSTELSRTELVTDNPEAVEKYRRIRVEINKRNHEVVKQLLEECKKLIPMEDSSNRQLLMRRDIINQYNCGSISKEEYGNKMKEALECTIPYKRVVLPGRKYLTNEEIACIQNMASVTTCVHCNREECISTLKQLCEQPKYPENYLRMFEFVMASVSSYLGDRGEYDMSDNIKRNIIKLLLSNRKGGGLHETLYGLLWNYEQKMKNNSLTIAWSTESMKKELQKCIRLSTLYKNTYRENIYRNKKVDMQKTHQLR